MPENVQDVEVTHRPSQAVHETGDSLTAYRRKIYLAALGLGAAASLVNLYITSSEHNPDLYERIVLPLLFSACASLLLILWRYPNSQPFVEAGMCLLASASLLSRLYFGLYLNANQLGLTVELSVLAAWIPIIYILNFLLLNGRLLRSGLPCFLMPSCLPSACRIC